MAESLSVGDIKFFYKWPAPADINRQGVDIIRDPGLETAALISIFTDGRADADDPLPDPNDTRRGWWGDVLSDIPIGSKLWLSDRSKILPAELSRQAQYIEDSLAWMKSDGLASKVAAMAERSKRPDEVLYSITITAPTGGSMFFQFFYNWRAQVFGGV